MPASASNPTTPPTMPPMTAGEAPPLDWDDETGEGVETFTTVTRTRLPFGSVEVEVEVRVTGATL